MDYGRLPQGLSTLGKVGKSCCTVPQRSANSAMCGGVEVWGEALRHALQSIEAAGINLPHPQPFRLRQGVRQKHSRLLFSRTKPGALRASPLVIRRSKLIKRGSAGVSCGRIETLYPNPRVSNATAMHGSPRTTGICGSPCAPRRFLSAMESSSMCRTNIAPTLEPRPLNGATTEAASGWFQVQPSAASTATGRKRRG